MPLSELIAVHRRSMIMMEERAGAEERMLQAWQSRWNQVENVKWTNLT